MNNMSLIKGIGIGMVVGSIAGMAMAPKKGSKAGFTKTLKSIGDVMDSVANTIGL